MLTYSTARIALSLMIGRGPSATNPSYPSGGTTSSPKHGYANSKPNIKQRKEGSQAGEKQDLSENHSRAHNYAENTLLDPRPRMHGPEHNETTCLRTRNPTHPRHRSRHNSTIHHGELPQTTPGRAPLRVRTYLELGFSLNPEVFVEFALHGSPM